MNKNIALLSIIILLISSFISIPLISQGDDNTNTTGSSSTASNASSSSEDQSSSTSSSNTSSSSSGSSASLPKKETRTTTAPSNTLIEFISPSGTDCVLTTTSTSCTIKGVNISLNNVGTPNQELSFNNLSYNGYISILSTSTITALGDSQVNYIKVDDSANLTIQGNNFQISNTSNIAGISGGANITFNWGKTTITSSKAGIATSGNITVQQGGNLSVSAAKVGVQIDQNSTSTFNVNNGGIISIISQDSIGMNVPSVQMQSGGNLNVTGSTYGIYSTGSITMDGGTHINGILSGDSGAAIIAKGISVINGSALKGTANNTDADANTFGVVSGWKSDISVSGNSSLTGSANTGITTIYPTAQDAGNIYLDSGIISGSSNYGDGVSGLNIYVTGGGSISGISNSQHGLGAIDEIQINNGDVDANGGEYGIGANGDITINDSKVDVSGSDEGICTDGSLSIGGESTVTITPPSTDETSSETDSQTATDNPTDTSETNSNNTPDIPTDPNNPTGSNTSTDNNDDNTGIHTGGDVNIDISGSGEVVIITDPTDPDQNIDIPNTDNPSPSGTTNNPSLPQNNGSTSSDTSSNSSTDTTSSSSPSSSSSDTSDSGTSTSQGDSAITTGDTTGYIPSIPGIDLTLSTNIFDNIGKIKGGTISISSNNDISDYKISSLGNGSKITTSEGVPIKNIRISVKPSLLWLWILIGIILLLLLGLILFLLLRKKKILVVAKTLVENSPLSLEKYLDYKKKYYKDIIYSIEDLPQYLEENKNFDNNGEKKRKSRKFVILDIGNLSNIETVKSQLLDFKTKIIVLDK